MEEPNSSKYAMDAHHRNITEIECLDEVYSEMYGHVMVGRCWS